MCPSVLVGFNIHKQNMILGIPQLRRQAEKSEFRLNYY